MDSPARKKDKEAKNPEDKVTAREMQRTLNSPIVSSIKDIFAKQSIRMMQVQLRGHSQKQLLRIIHLQCVSGI
jgi:hypothetical protein